KPSVSITSPARPIGCRSPGSLRRKPCWPAKPRTQPSEVANRKPAVGLALHRCPGRRSDQGTLARAGAAADCLYRSDPGSVSSADQSGPGRGAAQRPIAVVGPARTRILHTATAGTFLSGRAKPRSRRSAKAAGLPQRPARPALAAGAPGCQPRQPALSRNTAAAQPTEFAVVGGLARQIPCRTGTLREKNRIGTVL